MIHKYYLQSDWEKDWSEVTKDQYIKAEINAGLHKSKEPKEIAHAGFYIGKVRGWVFKDTR